MNQGRSADSRSRPRPKPPCARYPSELACQSVMPIRSRRVRLWPRTDRAPRSDEFDLDKIRFQVKSIYLSDFFTNLWNWKRQRATIRGEIHIESLVRITSVLSSNASLKLILLTESSGLRLPTAESQVLRPRASERAGLFREVDMSEATPALLPLASERAPRLCPVCGKPTYSREGIHPQCAEQQTDRERMTLLHSLEEIRSETHRRANPVRLKPFHRRCPNCSAELHSRKAQCACGQRIQLQPSSPKGFHRRCPKCRRQIHIRILVCPCGYEFLSLRLER